MTATYDVVIPTIGRQSLAQLLKSLARATGPLPDRVILVDDRRTCNEALTLGDLGPFAARIEVMRGAAAGPAAARNRGWRRASAAWIAFLDDDVVVERAWRARLCADLEACGSDCCGSQGDVRVPLPPGRRPTDWERNVFSLQNARWITADCAYRREALEAVDGFDERFRRAYREDADLALRLILRGFTIALGTRRVDHPVREAGPWISLHLQAGNADDALMAALHGPEWRKRAGASSGAYGRHVAIVTCAFAAAAFASAWIGATACFAWQRIAPGPRDRREITRMLATSIAIPFAAVYHRLRGRLNAAHLLSRSRRLPLAVIFDRDGTLIEDDPDLRRPQDVRLVPGSRAALERLRGAGIELGIASNQPRVGEGALSRDELRAINDRVEELLGPFAVWSVCTHTRDAGCGCRKPQPGLVRAAAATLGIAPSACVMVGDIGADVDAATSAGARVILVPTGLTLPLEVQRAPAVAADLARAVDLILSGSV